MMWALGSESFETEFLHCGYRSSQHFPTASRARKGRQPTTRVYTIGGTNSNDWHARIRVVGTFDMPLALSPLTVKHIATKGSGKV